MALIVANETLYDRLVGNALQVAADRRINMVAVGIGLHSVELQHLLPCHFRGIVCGKAQLSAVNSSGVRFTSCALVLRVTDVAQRKHAAQNPVAALFSTIGPTDGVVAGGCFGNSREHGMLGQA